MKNKLIYVFLFSSAFILLCTQMVHASDANDWNTIEARIHSPSRSLGGKVIEIRSADGSFTERQKMVSVPTVEGGGASIARALLTRAYDDDRDSETVELSDKSTGTSFLYVFGAIPSTSEDFTVTRLKDFGFEPKDDEFGDHAIVYIRANDDYSCLYATAREKGHANTAALIIAQLTE